MKILFDSNVIIDGITKRPNSCQSSKILLKEASQGTIEAYLVSKQITDIYYVLRKYVSDIKRRKDFIDLLLQVFQIIPLEKESISKALKRTGQDFEDDILMECALEYTLDGIVTINQKDYIQSPIKVYLPDELAQQLDSGRNEKQSISSEL